MSEGDRGLRGAGILFFFGFGVMLSFLGKAFAAESFRTPAKRYGSAYSIKVALYRSGVEFVVPMWVKPDQKESSIDPRQMVFMGWTFKDSVAEDVVISGRHFGKKQFKTARSDWVVKPEYPKNCCMGVIGQDFLKQYRLRFDPAFPAHIEWTGSAGNSSMSQNAKTEREFELRIHPLFSVRSEVIRVGANRYDLAATPFVLDFPLRTVSFEKAAMVLLPGRSMPFLKVDFSVRDRGLSLVEVRMGDRKSAMELGLKEGVRITELNGVPVSAMSYYEIESLLKGQKGRALEIGFLKNAPNAQKTKVMFDFEKNEFTKPGSIQSPARRN
ncbi:MAG: hypothetical protein KGP28_07345 [Bdellovibrionales bacterium]|nr:hypothetical protein [Bdellovibrionales bacterium]